MKKALWFFNLFLTIVLVVLMAYVKISAADGTAYWVGLSLILLEILNLSFEYVKLFKSI
jgi:hypothetical protein